jgi:hypothetical protein
LTTLAAADFQGLIAKMVPLDGIDGDIEHIWAVNYALGVRLPKLFYTSLISAVGWGLSRLIDGIWQGGRLTGDESDRVRSYLSSIRDDAYKMLDRIGQTNNYPLIATMTATSILPLSTAGWRWPLDPSDPFYMGAVHKRDWWALPYPR